MKRLLLTLIALVTFALAATSCSDLSERPTNAEHITEITRALGGRVDLRVIKPPNGPFTLTQPEHSYYIAATGPNDILWVRAYRSATGGWAYEYYEHRLFGGFQRVTL